MKKILFSTLLLILTTSLFSANDSKKMTDEELIAKIMQLEKREQKAIAKTKALDKLEKTVDKLAKTLQVDK
ncbi:MAG: hypothetical protein COB17_10465 [Sulfurimonas sp.]|nr:MAG: hypothetical protein COB17_10465 [Sulfurimonas sp.]